MSCVLPLRATVDPRGPRDVPSNSGVGNSFWLAGHLGNKNGLCGPVYYMDLNDLNFERKWAYSSPFSKKKHFKRGILMFYQLNKRSRATLRCLAGWLWPAGQTLPRPALDPTLIYNYVDNRKPISITATSLQNP